MNELCCPFCGSTYLHQRIVGMHCAAEEQGHTVSIEVHNETGEHSTQIRPRQLGDGRQSLSITFWCEGCHKFPVLLVNQHKGCTQMNFSGYDAPLKFESVGPLKFESVGRAMSEDSKEWEAFVSVYRIRDDLEATIKKAMDVLWNAKGDKWDAAHKAAEAVYEDMQLWDNLQTVVDALEELNDD